MLISFLKKIHTMFHKKIVCYFFFFKNPVLLKILRQVEIKMIEYHI